MGLCPSRNTKLNSKAAVPKAQTFTPLEPARAPSALRADAATFVPTPKASEPQEKEPWERFLDQKQQEQRTQPKTVFARKVDGTYTADYRRLLDQKEKEPKKAK